MAIGMAIAAGIIGAAGAGALVGSTWISSSFNFLATKDTNKTNEFIALTQKDAAIRVSEDQTDAQDNEARLEHIAKMDEQRRQEAMHNASLAHDWRSQEAERKEMTELFKEFAELENGAYDHGYSEESEAVMV